MEKVDYKSFEIIESNDPVIFNNPFFSMLTKSKCIDGTFYMIYYRKAFITFAFSLENAKMIIDKNLFLEHEKGRIRLADLASDILEND